MRTWKDNNKEKVRISNKLSKRRNRVRINAYDRKRYKENISYKLNILIKRRINDCIKKNRKSTKDILDYTVEDLKTHLESKFTSGMTWENHGEWHIDHIVPVSNFKFKSIDDEDFKKCWSLDNLQPLWATTEIAISYGEDNNYIGNKEKSNKLIIGE